VCRGDAPKCGPSDGNRQPELSDKKTTGVFLSPLACVLAFAVFALWRNGLIPQWFGVGLILAGFAMTLCIGVLYFGERWAARRKRRKKSGD
jgi:hypothetical protein